MGYKFNYIYIIIFSYRLEKSKMRGRKYEQIKTYSKIMKYKRESGKIEEVTIPKTTDKM